jgi:hypothetical protein
VASRRGGVGRAVVGGVAPPGQLGRLGGNRRLGLGQNWSLRGVRAG